MKAWPRPFRYFRDVRIFLVSVFVVVTIFVAAVFLLRYRAVNELLLQAMTQEAESYANLIAVTRHWNAQYGGVYVEKRPGVETNPFLAELGVPADIRTADGRVLTLRNPAIMTREISDLTRKQENVQFRMISLKALNPENAPDAFERTALQRFAEGAQSMSVLDRTARQPEFRYVRPLVIEPSCLACHGQQGYNVGDIRGGVSITISALGLLDKIRSTRRQLVFDAIVTVGILLAVLYFLTWKLAVKFDLVQKRLRHIAVTDELTGLKNRRYIMDNLDKEYQRAVRTGSPLSLAILDIDHFKKINDNFGHAAGDAVLKAVSREMESTLRSYDLLGRIGGEEFLIASPGSTLDECRGLAERIRERIQARDIPFLSDTISVTISAGVTSLCEQDAKAEKLLARADEALYTAKQLGRNRVVVL
ncbi:MAG: diguanylate cyclase [Nitrospiraceae bacterium]|nr:diguanylate cyclase [Nitrospiraceae bacterium]